MVPGVEAIKFYRPHFPPNKATLFSLPASQEAFIILKIKGDD